MGAQVGLGSRAGVLEPRRRSRLRCHVDRLRRPGHAARGRRPDILADASWAGLRPRDRAPLAGDDEPHQHRSDGGTVARACRSETAALFGRCRDSAEGRVATQEPESATLLGHRPERTCHRPFTSSSCSSRSSACHTHLRRVKGRRGLPPTEAVPSGVASPRGADARRL